MSYYHIYFLFNSLANIGESISDRTFNTSTKSGSPRFILTANTCFKASISQWSPRGPETPEEIAYWAKCLTSVAADR